MAETGTVERVPHVYVLVIIDTETVTMSCPPEVCASAGEAAGKAEGFLGSPLPDDGWLGDFTVQPVYSRVIEPENEHLIEIWHRPIPGWNPR